MLKILHINMHHHWGGQPNRILTESVGLRALGHEVWIAGPKDCMLCRRAREQDIPIFDDLELRRGVHPISAMRDIRKFKAFLKSERFDIVHSHGSQDTWLCGIVLRSIHPRPKFVRTRHNTFRVATHILNRWLHRQMDWIVTISPQVNQHLTGDSLFPAERITSLYSAPDPARFFPRLPSEELRASLGIPPGVPVIGKIGRLAPEKGHHLLISAAKGVVAEFPEARFLLVGKGRSREQIEKWIAEAGLSANFVLAGFRTDVPDLVALMDVVALTPTSGESLGTSLLEAMNMEKPVVATEVGGTGESVITGVTGFLIKEGPDELKIEGLKEAFLKLLRSSELRRELGLNGRKRVGDLFTADALASESAKLYTSLVQNGKESAPSPPVMIRN